MLTGSQGLVETVRAVAVEWGGRRHSYRLVDLLSVGFHAERSSGTVVLKAEEGTLVVTLWDPS